MTDKDIQRLNDIAERTGIMKLLQAIAAALCDSPDPAETRRRVSALE